MTYAVHYVIGYLLHLTSKTRFGLRTQQALLAWAIYTIGCLLIQPSGFECRPKRMVAIRFETRDGCLHINCEAAGSFRHAAEEATAVLRPAL